MLKDIFKNNEQYAAIRDEFGTWRIIDGWHPDVSTLLPDSDVDDGAQYVTVLKEGQFVALVKEAIKLGVLSNIGERKDTTDSEVWSRRNLELSEEIQLLTKDIVVLKDKNNELLGQLEKEKNIPKTESFLLKKESIAAVLKLAAMHDVKGE